VNEQTELETLRASNAALKERADSFVGTIHRLEKENLSVLAEMDELKVRADKAERERDEAVRAERERCAKIAESLYDKTYWDDPSSGIAGAIRAGEEKANG
jgi:hypothetical protein